MYNQKAESKWSEESKAGTKVDGHHVEAWYQGAECPENDRVN